ncbi:unnamed protein product [Adineta steineri]|uniref:Uncharacterized protein n=1 Tax=Adineta steineri TaxID=433720 RepID=A0A818S1X4_9BILA|nr:unnamed protein product [Adineta steineri]CAF3665588.1 unnamed protein product [Adineta steineri]
MEQDVEIVTNVLQQIINNTTTIIPRDSDDAELLLQQFVDHHSTDECCIEIQRSSWLDDLSWISSDISNNNNIEHASILNLSSSLVINKQHISIEGMSFNCYVRLAKLSNHKIPLPYQSILYLRKIPKKLISSMVRQKHQ